LKKLFLKKLILKIVPPFEVLFYRMGCLHSESDTPPKREESSDDSGAELPAISLNQESQQLVARFMNARRSGKPTSLEPLRRHYSTICDDGTHAWDIRRMTTDFSDWDGNYDGMKVQKMDREEIGMEILKAIIEHGSDANTRTTHGRTALQMSVLSNDLEYSKELIQRGADVFAKDEDGETALSLAKKWHKKPKNLSEIIAYLKTVEKNQKATKVE